MALFTRIGNLFKHLPTLFNLWWALAQGKVQAIELTFAGDDLPNIEQGEGPQVNWTLFDDDSGLKRLPPAFVTELILLHQHSDREYDDLAIAFELDPKEAGMFLAAEGMVLGDPPAKAHWDSLCLTEEDSEDGNEMLKSCAARYAGALQAGVSYQDFTVAQAQLLTLAAKFDKPELANMDAKTLKAALEQWDRVTDAHVDWLARAEAGKEEQVVH